MPRLNDIVEYLPLNIRHKTNVLKPCPYFREKHSIFQVHTYTHIIFPFTTLCIIMTAKNWKLQIFFNSVMGVQRFKVLNSYKKYVSSLYY